MLQTPRRTSRSAAPAGTSCGRQWIPVGYQKQASKKSILRIARQVVQLGEELDTRKSKFDALSRHYESLDDEYLTASRNLAKVAEAEPLFRERFHLRQTKTFNDWVSQLAEWAIGAQAARDEVSTLVYDAYCDVIERSPFDEQPQATNLSEQLEVMTAVATELDRRVSG